MASKENQELINNIITRLRNPHEYWVGVEELRNWEKTIQKAFDESELYKKAFEIATDDVKFFNNEKIRKIYLEQARKELENGE